MLEKMEGTSEEKDVRASDHQIQGMEAVNRDQSHCRKPTSSSSPSSPSSSSSSSSSGKDFFSLDASEFSSPGVSSDFAPDTALKPKKDADLVFSVNTPDSKTAFHHGLPPKYGEVPPTGEPTMLSGVTQFDMPSTTNPSSLDSCRVTQSPSTQVMGKWDVPDPYRIPSSVFEVSKSTTPMDWSVASNESLFSIHQGNNSFSRDHMFQFGRSGELTFPRPMASGDSQKDGCESRGEDTQAENAQAMMSILEEATDERVSEEASPTGERDAPSLSASHRSDCSGTSISSFAFPVLTQERGKNSCVTMMESEQQHQSKSPEAAPQVGPNLVQQQEQQDHQQESKLPEATPQVAPNTKANWCPCFSWCHCCC